LAFFKKKKIPEQELDLPPLEDYNSEIPEIRGNAGIPDFPELPNFPDSSLPELSGSEEEPIDYSKLPELPELNIPKPMIIDNGQKIKPEQWKPNFDLSSYEDNAEDLTNPLPTLNAPATKKSDRKGPVFITSEKYRSSIEELDEIEKILKEMKNVYVRLNEIKNEKDSEFEEWRLSLEDTQKKLLAVDKSLAR